MPSQDDIAVVRKFTDGLRAGDIAGCLELVHDDLVFSEAASLPFGGDHLGKDGLVRLLRAVGRQFRVELGVPELGAGQDFVAVRVNGTMTSRATGRSMPMDVVDVYRLRAGKIARIDVFYKDTAQVVELGQSQSEQPHTGQPENGTAR
jgi:ketosteroid isomerase-like protein